MNSAQLIGKGYQKIEELKQLFLSLTDSDLLLLEGKQDEILDKLQTNFGNTRYDNRGLIPEA
jgi:uncharacterized protein YjbJ (UPF0337 family)